MPKSTQSSDVLLLITPGCPHCAVVLDALASLVKAGSVGRLDIINLGVHPEPAAEWGVRTAPWIRIADLEFEGALTASELAYWAANATSREGRSRYVADQLTNGRLQKLQHLAQKDPALLTAVLPLLRDPDTSMTVRLGIGALLETLPAQSLLPLLPELGQLSTHPDHRVRSDACHYLGLTGDSAAADFLRARQQDENAEVREIASDALKNITVD